MTPPPSAAELEALGLLPEDVAEEPLDVWPENAQALAVFDAMLTQWIVGRGGRFVGLNYAVLPVVEARCGVLETDPKLFRDLREMEEAALEVINRA